MKICGLDYEIRYTDDDSVIGESSATRQTITISDCLNPSYKNMVLIHEWLHQVLHHNGYINETMNENLIQAIVIELVNNGFNLLKQEYTNGS